MGNVLGIEVKDKVNTVGYVKEKIEKVYSETNANLVTLKTNVKESLEKEVSLDDVKNVLKKSLENFGTKSFKDVYNDMGAGLVVTVQLALKHLGFNFDTYGIDGQYGGKGSETYNQVLAFQNKWNKDHADDTITPDGWAGKATVARILKELGENVTKPTTVLPVVVPNETPVVVPNETLVVVPNEVAVNSLTNNEEVKGFEKSVSAMKNKDIEDADVIIIVNLYKEKNRSDESLLNDVNSIDKDFRGKYAKSSILLEKFYPSLDFTDLSTMSPEEKKKYENEKKLEEENEKKQEEEDRKKKEESKGGSNEPVIY